MIRCVKCNQVHAIAKSGKIRGRQRYFCKDCQGYFTLPGETNQVTETKHQTTIVDIARLLKISKSTVSRALSGHVDINPKTRDQVLETARRLNYTTNQLAYSLVKGKTFTIGISVPELITTFFPKFIIACEEAAMAAGYRVIICHANESYENEKENLKMLFSNRVDGLLISLTRETKCLNHLKPFENSGIPIVMFNRVAEESNCPKVMADDYEGAFQAVEHLIRNGYQRIAHIAGPENLGITTNRYRGYRDALEANGLAFSSDLLVRHDLTPAGAREAARKILTMPHPPDAIFAVNDPTAIQAMMVARELGINIPQSLGIVGFSNDLRSEVIQPGLTTLEQPIGEMSKCAFQMLLQQMRGEDPEATMVKLKTKLIVRQSSLRW